jgi:hypothetical protein
MNALAHLLAMLLLSVFPVRFLLAADPLTQHVLVGASVVASISLIWLWPAPE